MCDQEYIPVPVHWCLIHGSAFCPDMYMLDEEGRPRPPYELYWHESMRCDKRVKVYRKATEDDIKEKDNV